MDVPLGISHKYLADECGGIKDSTVKIISGGPMMGMAMNSLDYPVTKTSSSILAITHDDVEKMETSACIRCGRCVGACPGTLVHSLWLRLRLTKTTSNLKSFTVWNVLNAVVAHMFVLLKDRLRKHSNLKSKYVKAKQQNKEG